MELNELCAKLRFDHLPSQLDALCEQAAKRELNYREFLSEALSTEWQGRRLKGVERGLRLARFPYIKSLERSNQNGPNCKKRDILFWRKSDKLIRQKTDTLNRS